MIESPSVPGVPRPDYIFSRHHPHTDTRAAQMGVDDFTNGCHWVVGLLLVVPKIEREGWGGSGRETERERERERE